MHQRLNQHEDGYAQQLRPITGSTASATTVASAPPVAERNLVGYFGMTENSPAFIRLSHGLVFFLNQTLFNYLSGREQIRTPQSAIISINYFLGTPGIRHNQLSRALRPELSQFYADAIRSAVDSDDFSEASQYSLEDHVPVHHERMDDNFSDAGAVNRILNSDPQTEREVSLKLAAIYFQNLAT